MVTKADLVQFILSFRVSAPSAVVMLAQLIHRSDESEERTRRPRAAIRRIGDTIRNEWEARNNASQSPDVRSAQAVLANSWGAMHGRLFSLTRLPAGTCEEQTRAADVIDKFFPTGLGMFRGDPRAQWLHSERLLKRATEPAMRAELDELAGAFVLTGVRNAHHGFSVALGIEGEDVPERQPLDMRELLAQFVSAVNDYAMQVVAVASEQNTPEALAHAYHLLEPIALNRSQSTSSDDGEDIPVDNGQSGQTPVANPVVQPAAPANDTAQSASRHVA